MGWSQGRRLLAQPQRIALLIASALGDFSRCVRKRTELLGVYRHDDIHLQRRAVPLLKGCYVDRH